MAKYHINGEGKAMLCTAKDGNCPFGEESEHFNSIEAAQRYGDRVNAISMREASEVDKEGSIDLSDIIKGEIYVSVPMTVDSGYEEATIDVPMILKMESKSLYIDDKIEEYREKHPDKEYVTINELVEETTDSKELSEIFIDSLHDNGYEYDYEIDDSNLDKPELKFVEEYWNGNPESTSPSEREYYSSSYEIDTPSYENIDGALARTIAEEYPEIKNLRIKLMKN